MGWQEINEDIIRHEIEQGMEENDGHNEDDGVCHTCQSTAHPGTGCDFTPSYRHHERVQQERDEKHYEDILATRDAILKED